MDVYRRKFLKQAAAFTALGSVIDWASSARASDRCGELLPQRQLTPDGTKVTALCLGGWHVGVQETKKDAEKLLEFSMESGIRFYDTARGYQKGRSESYMGQLLIPKYRDSIFLMTKSPGKNAKQVRQHLDDSLRALRTDYLDLWQIHSINSPDDVDNRIREGVLDVFLEAKEQGKAKYIGFTGHRNPETHLHFLEHLDKRGLHMDTCQLPLNVCDPSFESFEKHVLPVLLDKQYGVIAMKTMAGGSMLGNRIDTTPKSIQSQDIPHLIEETEITLANLHQYVYALPVSSLCSGCEKLSQLEHNVNVLKNLQVLSESDRAKLVRMAKPFAGETVENYKRVLG
ncbi:MAG: aldo/keto reductase [Verrucomicrobiota bacterium]